MSYLYIATKPVADTAFDHLYIVYDMDGNPNNNNELILRVGPQYNITDPAFLTYGWGKFEVELGTKIGFSEDALGDDSIYDRFYKNLNINGLQTDNVWNVMLQHAKEIKSEHYDYRDGVLYTPAQNSNSFVMSLLKAVDPITYYSYFPNDPEGAWPGTLNTLIDAPTNGYIINNYQYKLGSFTDDTLTGSSSSQKYVLDGGYGIDTITGNNQSDKLYGGTGNDTISGGGGNDKIYGGANNDTLYGGAGDDIIEGNENNDTLDGGGGKDFLIGGTGQDIYVWDEAYTGSITIDGGGGNDIIKLVGQTAADLFGHYAPTGAGAIYSKESSSWIYILGLKESPDAPVYFQNPDGSFVAIKSVFNDSSAPHFPGWDVPFGSPPSPTNPAGGPAIDPATIPLSVPPAPAPQPQLPDPNSPDPFEPDPQEPYGPPSPDFCPVPELPAFLPPLMGPIGDTWSPLVIDLDNDGLELTNLATNAVYWDIDNDGFKEAAAWVKADDALLVRDWNNNGQIDDHSELFGTQTVDGFTKLTELDSNLDNVMNSSDTEFANLKIWQDLNQDGISQSGELKTLTQAGITSISLNDSPYYGGAIEGNEVTHISTVTMADNSSRNIYDAWFAYNNQNTEYSAHYELDIRVLSLPTLRGFAEVKDLHIKASSDETLLNKVTTLAGMTLADVVDPIKNFDGLFKEMLFQWGEQNLAQWHSVASYYEDSRKVDFVQTIAGEDINADAWIGPYQVNIFRGQGLWEKISTYYAANFLSQTVFKGLFAGDALMYDAAKGVVTGATGLSATGLAAIQTTINASADPSYGWSLVVRTVEEVIGVSSLSGSDHSLLDNIIQNATTYTLDEMRNLILGVPNDVVATSANETITGTFANDSIDGQYGNDTLDGGRGDDRLYGSGGDDIYIGGAGDDFLIEAGGINSNDIYRYDSGNDIIEDQYGADKIILASGIVLADISIVRMNDLSGTNFIINPELLINVANKGSIKINANYNAIETLEFSTGSTINLATLDNLVNGTAGNDTINGADRAYYQRDYIDGGSGNDTINGGLGDDVLYGADGDDTYVYSSGIDIILDTSGTDDEIVFDNTYDPGKFTFAFDSLQTPYTQSTMSLKIYYDGVLKVVIDRALQDATYFVEKLVVTGVQTINLNTIDFTQTGTDSDNNLYGIDNTLIENNTIYAAGGNDYVEGRSGNDVLYGGLGNDLLYGKDGNDTLYGDEGNDTLTGDAGNDAMFGGAGDDYYTLDSLSDTVTENANEGIDTVQIALTYTLGANIENLTLTGANINGTGNSLNNIIIGSQGNNTLTGGDGNDTLDGNYGDDTLIGGIGDDIYIVDAIDDVVTESASQGIDTVQSKISYTLGTNVENLTLISYNYVNGTGNSLDNIIIGNSGGNILTGGGGNDTLNAGTGVDTLIGGIGNDIYIIDDVDDIVTENLSEGTDTIQVSVTYTLAANFENLTLTGSSNISGTGNALNNILTGNAANNTLTGGLGNDTYVINSASDSVVENASEGTDLVQSSAAAYTLVTNVENLTLIGTGNINGTGNTVNNIIIGNIGNNTLDGGTGNDTLSGGAGDDVYIIDIGDTVTELASEGMDTVQLAFTGYTLGANVENLTLTGASAISGTGNSLNNILTGNSGVNTLTGASGNDTLDGGLGNDTLIGGQGDDTYYLDAASDIVTENTSEGIDTVYVAATYTLSTNLEYLTLTGSSAINGTGNASDNILIGNSGVNTLTGANGNDTLDGGLGNDTLVGGAGDDIYYVDATDVVTEAASSGTDLVRSTAATYTLASNIENLTLMGTGNISGTGNTLANILTGNIGNNTLSGGTGSDTMIGGLGNDIYVVDNASDVVTENANEGTDTVQTVLAYTLGANVENLTLTSTGSVAGTGNALNNILTGNSGTNTLTGGDGNDTLDGGTGNDTMIGGIGDDIFVMNVATDIVTEAANEGTDTVRAAFTYTLLTNFENLTLTGTSNINATGNAYSNILIGNTGNNVLTGGTGNDTMSGGLGNDTYVVDSSLDIIYENAAEGTDLVQSSVTYILSNNVENLTLTGSAAINGIGNDLVNTITGNTGNNILNGGLGNDTMIGGTGDDTYIVDAADVVTEATSSGTDLVRSSAATYTLATNVENLTLMGSGNINGTGNTANNILTGNVGNNTLNGGTGVDTLIGGLGNDIYVIDTLTDTLTENSNEGIDTVQSTVTYTLLSNFENLTLTSTGTVNATGNTLDNILIGNTANNTLTGNDGNDTLYGDVGNDTLSGGNNNDTLYGGAGLDAMTGGAGADTFVFEAASAFSNVDTISDFTKAQADKLNIHDLLVGYTAGVSNIDDFVTVTTVGSNTSFLVDRDGAGSTYSDQAIATLNSITGLTVSDLFTNGHLIV